MVERALGRKRTVKQFDVMGEGIGWSGKPLIDEDVVCTFDMNARRRNELALECTITLSMMSECGPWEKVYWKQAKLLKAT